jgi:hypothetical protein
MRTRHQLLLRQGFVYSVGHAWTDRHALWLRQVGRELGRPAARATFEPTTTRY